ncbi:MAG: IPT/TIG domain-containing protein [Chloroflexi bacterium]|nr:IPT/TIG domain-containing protein [Chloroflexota bacterium]
MLRKKTLATLSLQLALIVALIAPGVPLAAPPQRAVAQVATTNSLRLRVVSARTEPDHPGGPVTVGDPVTTYQFMINVDNTGDPQQARETGCAPENPGYPDSCDWPSIRAVPGAAPVFTQGDNTTLNETTGFDLPDGKYLITVLADGYKIDGAHFSVPLESPGIVEVGVQPHPLPPATMRIKVFEDITSTNGQFDAPGESGLAGFRASINDILGEITVDVFGNPLCTEYAANGDPLPGNTGACLVSDANGDIAIPNLGPNRYDVLVIPPDGETWIETTTLEGSWSWDTWLQEGGTGLDNEFVVAGEPFPWTIFGFVRPMNLLTNTAVTGGVSGTVVKAAVYIPQSGGLPYYGGEWNGLNGAKVTGPIEDGWVALSDLQNGDTAVYIGQANPDGTFSIPHVPDGNYLFTYWDRKLHHILDWLQVTVSNGQMTDLGSPFLTGWFTRFEGTVFNDLNSNGKQDPGEPGIADYLVVLKDRDNTEIDRMSIAATTDQNGRYVFEKAYPMGSWMILEAYNDRYYTTGVTYQVENQPTETTVLGAGVDVGVLPTLGQTGRLDWGVRPYDRGINGGIVGTVSYDTTRNELDPRFAAVEGWQPGIPGLTVNLYGAVIDENGEYVFDANGAYARTALLNTTPTETWEQPVDCQARDANGNPLDQYALPPATGGYRCLEAPMTGLQFQSGFATLDGNYGFGDGCFGPGGFDVNTGACADGSDPTPLPAGDYLVEIVSTQDAFGNDIYKVTKEEDINIFDGDEFVPQVPPPACAGALHTVDVAGVGVDGPEAVDNPLFADGGGSPYEGMARPLCDVKLVPLGNGRSIAPTFNFFTEVPIPGKWKGYIIDDLTLETDQRDLFLGEKAGAPNMPIGIYDFTNRLITTIQSDPNGVFEVLLPSSNTINCPTPSGVCPNVYYMLGNDPGQPGRLNTNYNPQYRTIGASFEIWPGAVLPSDLAPTQIGVSITAPGSQFTAPPSCALDSTTPQLFAVSQPYVTDSLRTITLQGQGFGITQGAGQVTLDGTLNLPVTSWTDSQIVVTVPVGAAGGPHQLAVRAANGQGTVNGLTIHVLTPDTIPATAVLDNFNRTDNTNLGANWSTPTTGYRVNANTLQVRSGASQIRWTAASFGANQEAYFTFTDVSTTATEQDLVLKNTGGGTAMIQVIYNRPASQVRIETLDPVNGWVVRATLSGATFANGDRFVARASQSGTVRVYKNSTLIGSTNVTSGANPWPITLAQSGGQIGVAFIGTTNTGAGDARINDFGGGSLAAGAGYSPALYEVGPCHPYATIQSAIDAAAGQGDDSLVVVYPDTPTLFNPQGLYYENLVIYESVKLQGVGPGGVRADSSFVPGSAIDGVRMTGDTDYSENWRVFVEGLTWDGNQTMYEGPVIYLLVEDGELTSGYPTTIDGFTIQGGDQQGFPNFLPGAEPGAQNIVTVQGGGIFANAYARYLQITNNILRSNGGAYAGAIRLGTPHLPGAANDNQNDGVRIANNRILANGGTNLAGAIGLFSGSDGYEVAYNDICGNFSAEYGGGVSHYGYSPNGSIHHNRIYFNRSYDEGGGIMIAGELPADPALLSPGSGPVDIYNNLIQANLGNDDGGGIRFLMAGNFPMNVYNNLIVNNISTHEGGGISLNDAPDVRVFNNTIMKNLTTATAVTSNGQPAPAGLSSSRNSALLQATLPGGSPLFSNPLLFNNIFWENRAGTWAGGGVAGLGLAGDPSPINYWDLGVSDGTGLLAPTNSLLQVTLGTIADASNVVGTDPQIVTQYDTSVSVLPWRGNPRFIDPIIVAVDAPVTLLGDYHLQSASAAQNGGAASKSGVAAPATDYDGQTRPAGGGFDMGADEIAAVVAPFPATAVLDTFNRANNTNLGANWSTPSTGYRVNANTLQVRSGASQIRWTAAFGANQEAYFTFTDVSTTASEQDLVLKNTGGSTAMIQVIYNRPASQVRIETLDPVNGWVVRATLPAVTFVNSDQFGAQALQDGTVRVYKNGSLIGSTNVTSGAAPWPTALAQAGGQIGVAFIGTTNIGAGDARINDFGGGSVAAPLSIAAAKLSGGIKTTDIAPLPLPFEVNHLLAPDAATSTGLGALQRP